MNEIVEQAKKLGQLIASAPQATKLREARKAFEARADLVKLMKDYQGHEEKIAHLEQENKPIEVEDKHQLQELYQKMVADEIFKSLTAAQVEYLDLMRKVNDAMRQALAGVEE